MLPTPPPLLRLLLLLLPVIFLSVSVAPSMSVVKPSWRVQGTWRGETGREGGVLRGGW